MGILGLLLPPACGGCGDYGSILCGSCRGSFQLPSRVEDRFVVADAGVLIGDALRLGVAALAYEGPTRRALLQLKYGGGTRLAGPLAAAAAPALRGLISISGRASLVPVPLHADRRRARGYNQAALIADALARLVGLPVAAVLDRARSTGRQHHLDRAQRLANLRAAFEVRVAVGLPARAILVDDILTSGATLEACASTLTAAGCDTVYGFTLAREV